MSHYSKILKLSAVGLALLLIPRRSSRLSDNGPDSQNPTAKTSNSTDTKPTDTRSNRESDKTDTIG